MDFRNYKILGACNPQFAYKAVSLESHMGIMLPCNVVVQEHENGEVEITAVNPLENMDQALNTTILKDLAIEIGIRLRAAIDHIQRDYIRDRNQLLLEKNADATPCIQR